MKKIFFCVLVFMLIVLKILGAGAEVSYDWAFDPRINVYVVDRVKEEGRYSAYYCVGEEFLITLDRDVVRDDGRISMIRDNGGHCRLYYECDWQDEDRSTTVIDGLVRTALAIIGTGT